MISNVYVVFIGLTNDNNNSYCLSLSPKQLDLPVITIQHIDHLHNEIRYYIKQSFDQSSFKFTEECDFNIISLQNELTIEYLKTKIENYDNQSNLVILCGGILLKNKTKNTHHWHKLIYDADHSGFTNNTNLNLLIDHVINKTII